MHRLISSRGLAAFSCSLGVIGLAASSASALVIIPTFDSSITSSPNAADMEAAIQLADAQFMSTLLNPVTVRITFKSVNTGLGESTTFINSLTYAKYHTDLGSQTFSANDNTALATLPAGANNPVNGSTGMILPLPLLRALGESGGNNGTNADSTISLNTSLMNLLRTGSQDPSKYDMQAVAMHEITEVLGAGGGGSELGQGGSNVGTLDLYRYSAPGVRSYSTAAATSYFSINGGTTNLSYFNQFAGADYADWATTPPNAHPQVQDAFSTPGTRPDLDSNERAALDIVGWNLTPPGDATLDGHVDFNDLVVLAQHYGLTTGQQWTTGDFTSDGAVNFDDLVILAQNYNSGTAALEGFSPAFAADWTLARSLVPEPTTLMSSLTLTAIAIRRRRR